ERRASGTELGTADDVRDEVLGFSATLRVCQRDRGEEMRLECALWQPENIADLLHVLHREVHSLLLREARCLCTKEAMHRLQHALACRGRASTVRNREDAEFVRERPIPAAVDGQYVNGEVVIIGKNPSAVTLRGRRRDLSSHPVLPVSELDCLREGAE